LLHERLEQIGIDFGVFYTTSAMGFLAVAHDSMRQGLAAGWNAFLAGIEAPYRDRIAVAGMIPMHTPAEAIAELRHCHALGFRTVAFPEGVLRPIAAPDLETPSPFLWPGQTHWFDTFGLDSTYDYDPVWACAAELGYPVIFHGGLGLKPGVWTSVSNYSANHVGVFGQLMNAVCKSLYFGGTTRRFPDLPFVFLECGVSWGAQMLADIVEHWHKRRMSSLIAYDPAQLDVAALVGYFDRYGGDLTSSLGGVDIEGLVRGLAGGQAPDQPDDWLALDADDESTIVRAFTDSFYFGCEADDKGVGTAYSAAIPDGASLRPIFSSDIGHWDVSDIAGLVGESRELVEDGVLTEEQYRAFTFENSARLYLQTNPRFFEGTTIEADVARLVG
jgi:predicted TIM-barrel fold metal-dependent hydrolase